MLFLCLQCGEEKKSRTSDFNKFCSNQCQRDYEFGQRYERFLAGDETAFRTNKSLRRAVTHRDGYSCSGCGISEWNGRPIVFELEHKDGNSDNNLPGNLCLLCPNCHSQTPTYKSLNRGNGRHARRQRYAEGKSY